MFHIGQKEAFQKLMKVKISADSTCDLSAELIAKYDIGIVPLYIVKGGEALKDGLEIKPQDIYDYVKSTNTACSTAAVSVGDYIDYFTEILKTHDAAVHMTISSEMSACYQNLLQAAEEFPGRVFAVDARNLSTGIGQLVLSGAEMAASGMSAADIQAELNAKREKLDVSFVLDTLFYLHKGGRCSSIAALGANLLSLKPCIEVKDGKMGVGKKYRGSLKKSMLAYINDRLTGRDDIDYSRIFITHTDLDPEICAAVREAVAASGPWGEILETEAGCTISNHCGPGCMGVLFYKK